jgi:glycosyltransferase involved in cell wall biosynthesis
VPVVQKPETSYLLSVIIPISKMAGRLQNFEHTLSNITRVKDIQVILIHDLQDLSTGPEVKKIIESQPNTTITYIERFIGSPGGARNIGIDHVKGSWVNFVDSDDIYTPSNLIELLRSKESLDYSAVISNYETVDSMTNIVSAQNHHRSLTKVALRPGIWRWTFNADFIHESRFSDLSMGEDQKFLYDFCKVNREILFFSESTYLYTTNQELQLTNQREPKLKLCKVLYEVLKIRKLSQTNFDELTETMIVKLFISSLIYSTLPEKIKCLILFFPVLFPLTKIRLRYTKLNLRSWIA